MLSRPGVLSQPTPDELQRSTSDSITAVTRYLGVLAVVLASALPLDAQWPQFRGPAGDGTVPATALPLKWGEGQNVRWKTAVHGRAFAVAFDRPVPRVGASALGVTKVSHSWLSNFRDSDADA